MSPHIMFEHFQVQSQTAWNSSCFIIFRVDKARAEETLTYQFKNMSPSVHIPPSPPLFDINQGPCSFFIEYDGKESFLNLNLGYDGVSVFVFFSADCFSLTNRKVV